MNISEIAKQTGLSAKQIRDYEKAGLLPKTQRSESDYRIYSANDLARLNFIYNSSIIRLERQSKAYQPRS